MIAVQVAEWFAQARGWDSPELRAAGITAETPRAVLVGGQWLPRAAISRITVLTPPAPPAAVSQTAPWAHQVEAYNFSYPQSGVLLDMGMGTGKTKVAIDLIYNRHYLDLAPAERRPILVYAPKSVLQVWPDQARIHAGDPAALRVQPLARGSVAQRVQLAQRVLALDDGRLPIIVVNYEVCVSPVWRTWASSVRWGLLVLDECHRIKSPGGRISRYISTLALRVPWRLGLSGTPCPHSPLDLYAQGRAIEPSVYGTSFTLYRSHYAIMGGYENHEIIGYQNQSEWKTKFDSFAYHAGRELLDLPSVQHIPVWLDLEPLGWHVYEDLSDQLLAWLDAARTELVTAANAMVRVTKLQTVTSGSVHLEDGRWREVSSAKLDALVDLVADLPPDEPVVVVMRYREDLRRSRARLEALGVSTGELSGSTNDLARWQGGELRALVLQQQAGGLGIDLTRARHCIIYSLGFSLGDYEQVIARIHRPGQSRSVIYHHLIVKGSVDEYLYSILTQRKVDIMQMNGQELCAELRAALLPARRGVEE